MIPKLKLVYGDNLDVFPQLTDKLYQLIYIDPPFNTGKTQAIHGVSYEDEFGDDFIKFIKPRLYMLRDLLTSTGSLFVHLDYREVHYVKVLLDEIFGRANFMNEIIWAYDYGSRSKNRWPRKHDTILWYTKHPTEYCFNYDEMDRLPYMAPGLVGKEKAERGKTPTDVWWNTIVPTNGSERLGYPTQKPLAIIERIVKIHSNIGDNLLDIFAGSGTFGEAALKHGRNVTLVDNNSDAISIMTKRLAAYFTTSEKKRCVV